MILTSYAQIFAGNLLYDDDQCTKSRGYGGVVLGLAIFTWFIFDKSGVNSNIAVEVVQVPSDRLEFQYIGYVRY